MAGPHPSSHDIGAEGPPHPSLPTYPETPPGEAVSATYPGPLPPALPYPSQHRRQRAVVAAVLVVALLTALVAVTAYVVHDDEAPVAISEEQARTAIQGYLDALSKRDIQSIARNTLCGIYDAVREKQSDDAVAKLNSDAFRKQFSEAEVTSIDKVVYLSGYQAQVLFTMRVVAPGGSASRDTQGVAQLLATDNKILVCSYVLHTSGTY
ncbi:hypothetical protein ACAG26_06595 [Mycobacterium sp. pUA109]|uniref:Rv0361 family membrane protein n=1 Tax=Mycobacterium sp. pUA109 TaxID=3238982 RepID=UPI00351B3872